MPFVILMLKLATSLSFAADKGDEVGLSKIQHPKMLSRSFGFLVDEVITRLSSQNGENKKEENLKIIRHIDAFNKSGKRPACGKKLELF